MGEIELLKYTIIISASFSLLILIIGITYLCYELLCNKKMRLNSQSKTKYKPKSPEFIKKSYWFSRPIEEPLKKKVVPMNITQSTNNLNRSEEQIGLISNKSMFEIKSEIQKLEKSIFEKSFELIEKSNSQYWGIKNVYSNVYNCSSNGQIDWHRIYFDLNDIGNGYIAAIEKTGRLLANTKSNLITEIYSLADKLIELREESEKQRKKSNKIYNNYSQQIEAWRKFKQF